MAWGFKDWVRGRPYKPDPRELALPQNASERAIRSMALRMLDEKTGFKAYQLLDKQPERARPVLESLLREDERFRTLDRNLPGWGEPVYAVIVRILGQWGSEYAVQEALKLSELPDARLRAAAARVLGETGRARFAPTLLRLSEDASRDVRLGLALGLSEVIEHGDRTGRTLQLELARLLYKFMRDCSLTTYGGPCFVATLFEIDREAALRDLDPETALTPDRVWLTDLIEELRAQGIVIPHTKIISLLDHAIETVSRSDFNSRECGLTRSELVLLLKLRAEFDRDGALKHIRFLRTHPHELAREAALDASDDLLGNPMDVAYAALSDAGSIEEVRAEHANVLHVEGLLGEVSNGGWLQWIANPSGAYAAEALAALKAIDAHAAAEQLEAVMRAVGRDGSSPDQRKRMAAIDRMMNEGRELPDDGILWGMSTDVRLLIRAYAWRHPRAFPTTA